MPPSTRRSARLVDQAVDVLLDRSVPVVGSFAEIGQFVEKASLFAGRVSLDDYFGPEQRKNAAVGVRAVSSIVENGLSGMKASVVEAVYDYCVREFDVTRPVASASAC